MTFGLTAAADGVPDALPEGSAPLTEKLDPPHDVRTAMAANSSATRTRVAGLMRNILEKEQGVSHDKTGHVRRNRDLSDRSETVIAVL